MTYLVDRHGGEHHVDGIRIRIRDPIDNGLVLRNSTREELFAWCGENCSGAYWVGMGFAEFELEQDATLFRLVWWR